MKTTLLITSILFVLLCLSIFTKVKENENLESQIKIRSTSSPNASYKSKKARSEYFNLMLRDPETKKIPNGIRQKELAFAKQLQETSTALKKNALVNDLGWQEAGPNNVGGRTRALAVDVTNSNTIIAGGVSGGVWKSTDKGETWQIKSTFTQVLSVTTLVQDPRQGHTNTWYYGTGEYTGSAEDQVKSHLFSGDGIYKSTDNGETWNVLPATQSSNFTTWDSPFDFVQKIEINPLTGTIFVATNGDGIFRSADGGNSFSLSIGGRGHHFSSDISIAGNGTMVAALASPFPNITATNTPGVYKSADDGSTWTSITPTTFPQTHERSLIEIALSNPDVAYIVTYPGPNPNAQYEDIKFHKINISSGTSEDRSENLPVFPSVNGTEERVNTQRGYNLTLAVKPNDENFVLIGATSLYRSTNGFASKPTNAKLDWIGGYHPTYFGYPNFHPDIHSFFFEQNNPDAMWWGHDGGLSYTSDITNTNFPDIFPWENKNNGYNVTQFYHISIPQNSGDNRIMGGTQDNGTPFFEFNGSIGNQIADVSSGDGANSYFGQNYAYTSVYNGIIFRLGYDNNNYPNNQFGYTEITPTGASNQFFINPFAIDPSDENVLYYPAGNSLWRNNQLNSIPEFQNGTSVGWTKLDNVSLPSGYAFHALAVSESNPAHRIYYGGIDFNKQSTGAHKLFKLDNANTATTGAVEITVPGTSQWSFPNSIAVNPDNADEIIVVFSNYNIVGVYHSFDGGQSYTAIEGNLKGDESNPGPSTRSAVILPTSNSTQYFLATSTGVYSTTALNGENTVWNLEGANTLGNVVVNSLAARKSDGRIVAGTHGRGAFVATASSGSGGSAIANVSSNILTLQTRPGESNSTSFELSNAGDAVLNFNITASGSFGVNLPKISGSDYKMGVPDINSIEYKLFKQKSKFKHAKDDLKDVNNYVAALSGYNGTEGDDYLIYDDGDQNADTFVGIGDGYEFDYYNHFNLSGFDFEAESFEFFLRTENSLANNIFAGLYDSKDSLLQFGYFTFDLSQNGQWYNVTFSPKVNFKDGDNFKIEILSYSLINYPAGIDTDAQVPNRSFFFDPSVANWVNINTQSGYENGAFLIRVNGTKSTGGGGENQNPVPVAKVSTSQASVNETITFDGSDSYDPDGQIVQYLWDFGDGVTSTQPSTTHSYSQPNTYNISLTVTDNLGATGQVTGQIIVSGENTNYISVSPQSGSIPPGGSQTIAVTLNAQDLNVGTYTGQVNVNTNGGNLTIPINYLVDVEQISSLPVEFSLRQNYPNPFNPSTVIEFSLPKSSNVSLKIYDILGKEVANLLNENKSAGSYKVEYDASDISSGIYIYKIEADGFSRSRKMLFLK